MGVFHSDRYVLDSGRRLADNSRAVDSCCNCDGMVHRIGSKARFGHRLRSLHCYSLNC